MDVRGSASGGRYLIPPPFELTTSSAVIGSWAAAVAVGAEIPITAVVVLQKIRMRFYLLDGRQGERIRWVLFDPPAVRTRHGPSHGGIRSSCECHRG